MMETAVADPITRDHALHLLAQMLRIRQFEDRCAKLYTEQKIRGFLHLYNGEEAVAVGVMQALESRGSVVATYREHGHALARAMDPRSVMAALEAKDGPGRHVRRRWYGKRRPGY